MRPVARVAPGVGLVLRLLLGGVMLWAGLAKVGEPALFAQTVRAYDILPVALIHPFAVVMPWMEIVAGAFLVLGLWVRGSALASLGLLVSFAVALVVNLARGADFDCGCFGLDGAGGGLTGALIKDVVMILFSVLLLRWPDSVLSADRLLQRFGRRWTGQESGPSAPSVVVEGD